MNIKLVLLALTLGASTCLLSAQDAPRPRPAPGQGGPVGPGNPGGTGGPGTAPRMVQPVIDALDLNKDGTIDAEELAKATESLKKLDKNGDGKITPEEYRPQRPAGFGGPGGQGGPNRGPRPQPQPQQQPQ